LHGVATPKYRRRDVRYEAARRLRATRAGFGRGALLLLGHLLHDIRCHIGLRSAQAGSQGNLL
jgi:hypothetical protein